MPETEHNTLTERGLVALRTVMDPELGLNVVDLGLVRSLTQVGNTLNLAYKLTSANCPVGGMIVAGMHEALQSLEGCQGVNFEMLDEPWSPDEMSPEGRAALGL